MGVFRRDDQWVAVYHNGAGSTSAFASISETYPITVGCWFYLHRVPLGDNRLVWLGNNNNGPGYYVTVGANLVRGGYMDSGGNQNVASLSSLATELELGKWHLLLGGRNAAGNPFVIWNARRTATGTDSTGSAGTVNQISVGTMPFGQINQMRVARPMVFRKELSLAQAMQLWQGADPRSIGDLIAYYPDYGSKSPFKDVIGGRDLTASAFQYSMITADPPHMTRTVPKYLPQAVRHEPSAVFKPRGGRTTVLMDYFTRADGQIDDGRRYGTPTDTFASPYTVPAINTNVLSYWSTGHNHALVLGRGSPNVKFSATVHIVASASGNSGTSFGVVPNGKRAYDFVGSAGVSNNGLRAAEINTVRSTSVGVFVKLCSPDSQSIQIDTLADSAEGVYRFEVEYINGLMRVWVNGRQWFQHLRTGPATSNDLSRSFDYGGGNSWLYMYKQSGTSNIWLTDFSMETISPVRTPIAAPTRFLRGYAAFPGPRS